jgi:hypothetical protein
LTYAYKIHIIYSVTTIARIKSYRIEVRTRDHNPPHFHIVGPDGEAMVRIKDFEVLENRGVSEKDINKILKFLQPRKKLIQETWNEHHE